MSTPMTSMTGLSNDNNPHFQFSNNFPMPNIHFPPSGLRGSSSTNTDHLLEPLSKHGLQNMIPAGILLLIAYMSLTLFAGRIYAGFMCSWINDSESATGTTLPELPAPQSTGCQIVGRA
ncbi:hypothetical protein BDN67DRAFT_430171 [Paxillus ammoniavirescens]|nr:hypothetical protein BDN67DRAFT_430171 [Paxillus ammoniavirescens]